MDNSFLDGLGMDNKHYVIAIRYNRGPELTLDEIKKGTQSYGEGIRSNLIYIKEILEK